MNTNTQREVLLTTGPSREEMFDCCKYHANNRDLAVVEFYTSERHARGRSSSLHRVMIEGLFYGGDDGREWFFWGRVKQVGSGDTWKHPSEAPDGSHVFGRWNTHHRRGKIIFSESSFFVSPLSKGLNIDAGSTLQKGVLSTDDIMERLGRLNRLGTSVMCRPDFPAGPGKWYVNLGQVHIPVHTMDMSGPTPEEAIMNTWRAITDKERTHILIRYFCQRRDEPIPGHGPQVWVRWSHNKDDWEDVLVPNDEWSKGFASHASEIRSYNNHRYIEMA